MTFRDRLLRWLVPQHDRAGIPRGHPGHAANQLKRLHADEREPVYVPESDFRTSMRAIADREFVRSQRYREQQTRASREGCHPDIIRFERLLVEQARRINVPLFAHSMMRDSHEQDALFERGVTKARAGESPHNFGLAVDVIHGTKAWDISRQSWSLLGHMGKELAARNGIKVTWGGDWKFYDPAHWELANWKELL